MHSPDSSDKSDRHKLAVAESRAHEIIREIRSTVGKLSMTEAVTNNTGAVAKLQIAESVLASLEGPLSDAVFAILSKGLKVPTTPLRTPSRPPEVTLNIEGALSEAIDQLPYESGIRGRLKQLFADIGMRTVQDIQLFSNAELAKLPYIGRHASILEKSLLAKGITLATETAAAQPPLSASVAKLYTQQVISFDLRQRTQVLRLVQITGLTLDEIKSALEAGLLRPSNVLTKKQIGKIEIFLRHLQLDAEVLEEQK